MGRGQLQLSFTMLFSIIVIIATVATAFYFIRTFLQTSDCTQVQLFQKEMQDTFDNVWRATLAHEIYTPRVPGGITSVCFGVPTENNSVMFEKYALPELALYLGPPAKVCDGALVAKKLTHVYVPRFFCAPIVKGHVAVTLTKASPSDTSVTLS